MQALEGDIGVDSGRGRIARHSRSVRSQRLIFKLIPSREHGLRRLQTKTEVARKIGQVAKVYSTA